MPRIFFFFFIIYDPLKILKFHHNMDVLLNYSIAHIRFKTSESVETFWHKSKFDIVIHIGQLRGPTMAFTLHPFKTDRSFIRLMNIVRKNKKREREWEEWAGRGRRSSSWFTSAREQIVMFAKLAKNRQISFVTSGFSR